MTQYIVPIYLGRFNVFEEATPGGVASFRCAFKAHPQPVVTWYKDDLPLADDVRISIYESIKENETNLSLTIHGVTKKDEGSYRCSIENSEGVASTTGYLSVLDISDRINDPDPIDQSLIDLLLLRSSSIDQSTTVSTTLQHPYNVIENTSKDDDTANSIDELPEIEYLMSRLFDKSVELNEISGKSNNSKQVGKKNSESKKSQNNDTSSGATANVYTIMNSDRYFYDSSKPIEISKFDKQHIPEKYVNNVNSLNSLPTELPSDRLVTYNRKEDMNCQIDHEDVGDVSAMKKRFDSRKKSFEDGENFSRECKYLEENIEQHVMGDNMQNHQRHHHRHHQHHHQDHAPEENFHTRPKQIQKPSDENIIVYSKTTSWKKLSKDKSKDFVETKSPKIMKWLKAKNGSIIEQDSSIEKNSIEEKTEATTATMNKKKVLKSPRKVCYEEDNYLLEAHEPGDFSPPPPPPPPPSIFKNESHKVQPIPNKSKLKPFEISSPPPEVNKNIVNEDLFFWNHDFTNLFKFPKVLILIVILTASIYLLSNGYSTWSVFVGVVLSWVTAIILAPYLRMHFSQ